MSEDVYQVVQSSEYQEFKQRVNDLMSQGWKPQGSASVLEYEDDGYTGYHYFQAMVYDPPLTISTEISTDSEYEMSGTGVTP